MQPNFPTPGCTLLSNIPRQNPRKAQWKYLQIKSCNLYLETLLHHQRYMKKLHDSTNQPLPSRARRKTHSNTKRKRRAQCPRPTKGKVTSYRVFRLVFLSYLIFSLLSTWLPRSIPAFVCFFCLFLFFWARPRGTLIAAAIIKETGKLRINLSLGSLFWFAPTLCQSNVKIFCTAKYACRPRGLPSTRNQWIQSLKSQLFETGIQQGPI